MTFKWMFMPLLLLLPSGCLAVDKEIVRLQRDVALLNEDVRALQRSLDERMGAMTALVRQTLDRVNEVHTANTVMQSAITNQLRQQEKNVTVPAATLGVKLDRMTTDSLAAREAIDELGASLKRLELKLVDMENAVRILQAPPAPPNSFSEAMGGPPAGVTAQGLFQSAMADQISGNYDMALQEFQDYLRWFGNTELAVASQFHIGEIHLYNGDPAAALEAFDRILKQYPKSGKAPDAFYLKAKVLEKDGKSAQAVHELNKLLRAYPNSDAANRAPSEIKRLQSSQRKSRTASRK